MSDTPDMDRDGAPDDDTGLAAEYVLRLMDDVTRAEFEARLALSAELRAEVAFWEAEFAGMAEAELRPVPVPDRVKGHLMHELFPEPPRPPLLMQIGLWQALTFASLCLSAGLAWQVYQAPEPTAPPLLVGEIAAEDESRLRLLAAYDGVDGTLRLSRTDGVAAPGRVLELWAIAGEDAAPVSLGLLSEDAEGTVTLPENLREIAGDLLLAISDEPPGGSPTGAPTGEVLALGRLTDL